MSSLPTSTSNASASITGHRAGSAVYKKGRKRLSLILRCAERRMVQDGYGKFSMRNVAGDAGISLAALQHYFPTLQLLVNALLEHLVARYTAEIIAIPELASQDSVKRFNGLVNYYLVDSKSDYKRRLFAELWALALRDQSVAEAMDEMTSVYQERFERAIAGVNPDLSAARIRRRARLIIAQIDGLNQYVLPETGGADIKSLEREAQKQMLALAVMP